jgi:4-hydroxy-4-methyl-2-oxoglutarate aldolase
VKRGEEMDAHVIKEISRPAQNRVQELADFETATVHEAYGGKGALSCDIKPVDPSGRVCGPAVTVSGRPGDNLILHKAIYVAEPGDVLVATVGGYTEAGPWGEIMTVAAQARKIAGLIIDGSVRDSSAIRRLAFPVFSRAISIKGTTKETLGLINHPIHMGGIPIRPGDIVLGDADGVVVVAAADLTWVLEKCRQRRDKEEKAMEEIRRGRSTLELYGFDKVLNAKGLREE